MTRRRDVERDLRRFRVGSPRPELARRVIRAAVARLAAAARPSRLERMWASRPLRWAWVASLALLLLAGAGSERLVVRRLERAMGPPARVAPQVLEPESLGLDASWAPRLAWAARVETAARAVRREASGWPEAIGGSTGTGEETR